MTNNSENGSNSTSSQCSASTWIVSEGNMSFVQWWSVAYVSGGPGNINESIGCHVPSRTNNAKKVPGKIYSMPRITFVTPPVVKETVGLLVLSSLAQARLLAGLGQAALLGTLQSVMAS